MKEQTNFSVLRHKGKRQRDKVNFLMEVMFLQNNKGKLKPIRVIWIRQKCWNKI